MARTALGDLLRQAYQVYRISTKTGMSGSEAADWAADRLSRRQFLAGIAATVALSTKQRGEIGFLPGKLLPSRADRPVNRAANQSSVLIVGAGVAGLTAAYRLQQAGVQADVVEAGQRVGGRLRSWRNAAGNPGVVEMGGEFIDTRHTAVRSLATELGLTLADLRLADRGLEPEVLFFGGQRISPKQVIEEFSPLAERLAADLAALGNRDISYHAPNEAALRLDRLSIADYLAAAPISPLIEKLVKVAYITEFGRDAESQSCLNMLFLIGSEVGKWSTYGVSDERYHVVGGNDQIPQKLAERLQQPIATGTVLESIRATADGRYQVSLRQGATSRERIYERVLITVPFGVLRQVELAIGMSPVKQRSINELGYGTSSKLSLPFQERVWRSRYRSTISVYSDLDFQNTWESARYATGSQGWLTNLRGGAQGLTMAEGSTAAQSQNLLNDFERIFPGITQAQQGKGVRSIWAAEPYALGSYSCYLPGQWTAIGGAEGERVGNVWFAGEHCSPGSQGYMNGACETAEIAAREILQDLGVKI
jgi:monoamine oxidase